MSETKIEAGQWYESSLTGQRLFVHALNRHGMPIWETQDGIIWSHSMNGPKWKHLPGCDSWDWVEPAEKPLPRYFVYTGTDHCDWDFVKVTEFGAKPMKYEDGIMKPYSHIVCRKDVDHWTKHNFWKEITEDEAEAMKAPAEVWPKFYVPNWAKPTVAYFRVDDSDGNGVTVDTDGISRGFRKWHDDDHTTTEVTEAEAKSRVKPAAKRVDDPICPNRPGDSGYNPFTEVEVTTGNCEPSTFRVEYEQGLPPVPEKPAETTWIEAGPTVATELKEESLPPVGEGFRRIDPAVDEPEKGDEMWLEEGMVWSERKQWTNSFGWKCHYRRRIEPEPQTISLFVPLRSFSEPDKDFPVRCSLTGVTDVASWVKVSEFRKEEK